MARLIDMTGMRFGRLVVLRLAPRSGPGPAKWVCLCSCGAETVVASTYLRTGHTKSCGCLSVDALVSRRRTHGHSPSTGRKDGAYRVWQMMRKRCSDPTAHNWKYYGGRGIRVWTAWESDYATFIRDVGPRPTPKHTLDRIDPDGNYEPGNVRWATPHEQRVNRSKGGRQ